MALNDHEGLLTKFQVSPPSCCLMSILTLKVICSSGNGQKTRALGQLGRPTVKVKRPGKENGKLDLMYIWIISHHFQVQDMLKEEPYYMDLADHFQNVNSLL